MGGGGGLGTSPGTLWIKGAVKGLLTFAKRARAHDGEIAPDDLKGLKEAKKQADEAYRSLTTKITQG